MLVDTETINAIIEKEEQKIQSIIAQLQGIINYTGDIEESLMRAGAENRIAGLEEGLVSLAIIKAEINEEDTDGADEEEAVPEAQPQIVSRFKQCSKLSAVYFNSLITFFPNAITPIPKDVLCVDATAKSGKAIDNIEVFMYKKSQNGSYFTAKIPNDSFDVNDQIVLVTCRSRETILCQWDMENTPGNCGLHIEFKVDNNGNTTE